MKKIKFCMLVFVVVFMLGGCGKSIDLTDEQTDMFAEYISKEVLERDKHYEQELIAPEQEEADDEEEEQSNPTMTEVSNKQEEESVSLNDLLGTSSINVSFASAKLYNSYPEEDNDYFVISANDGYKLLVIKFKLENTKKQDVTYSMLQTENDYRLTTDNGGEYNPLLTLLVDDLQFINKTIPAGSKQEGVLVFRIPEGKAASNKTLTICNGNRSTVLSIN